MQVNKTLFFLVLLCCSLFFPSSTLAQAESDQDRFYTTLVSTYSVDKVGNTRVEHVFQIKNNTPEYFINQYSMKLGTDAITDISVNSNNEQISPKITQDHSGTNIEIEFPDKVVGKDKIRQFRISYQNPVMSEVSGQVLETYIPAMSSNGAYDEHKVILATPIIFGYPTRIKPDNYKIKQDGQSFVLTYENLLDEGVSAIFGSQQIFKFSIRYHLDNPNNQPAITQVSLPPDTPYQKMHYHVLEPLPQKLESDVDGNWIATYYLPANDTVEVNIEALTLVSLEELHPWLNIKPIKEHLSNQPFWEKDHKEISSIADNLEGPFSIYQYVVDTLDYTQEDLSQNFERQGALTALRNPSFATCQEFSDLFIALARTKNIPTRRATGYAHSNDPILQPLSLVTDILHAWPEYYDLEKESWIPIDPTWGDTMRGVDYFHQFDLKHVVFAYNGKSSQLPLAAGNYKLPDSNTKDLQVQFEDEFPEIEPSFSINLKQKKLLGLINLPSWYEIEIENMVGQAWYNSTLEISGVENQLDIELKDDKYTFLPWQIKNSSIQVYNKHHQLPTTDKILVTLSIGDVDTTKEFEIKTIKPFAPKVSEYISQSLNNDQQYIHPNLIITRQQVKIVMAISLVLLAITTWSLLVSRRKKQYFIRRQSKKSKKSS